MTSAAALGELSGWVVAAMVALTIPLPYVLRGRLLAPAGWGGISYMVRLRPHYGIGYTIAGLGVLHAGLAMSSPLPFGSGGYATGLWVATGAILLVIGQATVGHRLRSLRGEERLRLRRTHFRLMVLLVAGGLVHVLLNGAVFRSIAGLVS
jgi:hypothetical protein